MILVVEPDEDRRAHRESTLERLKFAVAAFPQAEPAVAALSWFSPDVVVIDRREARAFREAAPGVAQTALPLVEFSPGVESDEAVIDAVRDALRAAALATDAPSSDPRAVE